jgi:hypothetical protein
MNVPAVQQLQQRKHDGLESDMLARMMLSGQQDARLRIIILVELLLHLRFQLSLSQVHTI